MVSITITALLATVLLATFTNSGAYSPIPRYPYPPPPKPSCPKANTVTVTGSGIRYVKTDIAEITVTVNAKGKTAVLTHKNLYDTCTKLFAYLHARKAEKAHFKYVSVYEDYSSSYGYGGRYQNFSDTVYASPEPSAYGSQSKSYVGTKSVTFEVPVAKVVEIIDGAAQKFGTGVSGMIFKSDPVAYAAARQAAIDDAVKNAKKEASVAAKALARSLGKSTSIKIIDDAANGNHYGGYPYNGVNSHFAAGEQSVTAHADISFFMW